MKTKALLLISALAATCFAGPASASLIYTFNANLAGGPFGTVTLTQNGANRVDVSVALTSGVGFVETGIDNFVLGVVNSIPLAAGNFSNFSAGWSFQGAPTNVDGFPGVGAGFTAYALNCTSCGNGGNTPNPGPLNFTVIATGLLETSFSSLFMADICTSFTAGQGCSGATGATWTTSTSTSSGTPPGSGAPEPGTSSLALLGVVILAATFLKRRMSRQA